MGAAVIVEQVGDRRPRLFQLRDSAQGIHPQGPARTNAAAGNGGKNFRVNFSRQFNGFQERPYSCQDMGEEPYAEVVQVRGDGGKNANLTALLGNPWKQGHKGSIRPAGIQKVTETGVYRKRKRARRVAVLKNGIGDGDRISLCLYGWMVNRDHECWKSWRILCLMPVGGRSLSASRRSKVTAQGSCPSPLALACLSISWA